MLVLRGVGHRHTKRRPTSMANIMTRAAVAACGLAGILAVTAVAPAMAQAVIVDPSYRGPQAYVSPYGGYAYAPGYGARDTGMARPATTLAAWPIPTGSSACSRGHGPVLRPTHVMRVSASRTAASHQGSRGRGTGTVPVPFCVCSIEREQWPRARADRAHLAGCTRQHADRSHWRAACASRRRRSARVPPPR